MGIGIVTITKSYNSEEWSNNYGVICNDEDAAQLTISDLTTIGVGQFFGDEETNPASGTEFLGATYLLHSLIAFERTLHCSPIQFVRCDVSDGKKGGEVFASIPLSFAGLVDIGTMPEANIAPGNVALLVNKTPMALAVRSGRSFYRGVLTDTSVRFAGRGGVDWTDDTYRTTYRENMDGSIAASEILAYLGAGALIETQALGIPQYAPLDATVPGDLVRVNAMSYFAVQKPVSRQMKRGKKRTIPAPTP